MNKKKIAAISLCLLAMGWAISTYGAVNGETPAARTESEAVLPLKPVAADSVQLLDFFWSRYREWTSTQTFHKPWPWQVKGKVSHMRLSALAEITLTGGQMDIERALRLFQDSYQAAMHTGEARYFDLAERLLYNRILAYWRLHRYDATDKSIPRISALLHTAGTLAYAIGGRHIYVNLLARGLAHLKNREIDAYVQAVNSSPWYYKTALKFQADNTLVPMEDSRAVDDYTRIIYHDHTGGRTDSFRATLHIRIPSWATGQGLPEGYRNTGRGGKIQVFVNGVINNAPIKDGYVVISGLWSAGDQITVNLPAPILRISRKGNSGEVALQRGPMVYGVEGWEEGMTFSPGATVSHRFSPQDSCIVLSVPVEKGGRADTLRALPYYKLGEKGKIFMRRR